MKGSLFFKTISKFLFPAYVLASLLLYWRGHNAPGGGFIGGLLAAISFAVIGLALGKQEMNQTYRFQSFTLVKWGLLVGVLSGFVSVLALPNGQFFQGYWVSLFGGALPLGTPMLFDLGVFLVVLGIGVNFILTLLEYEDFQ